MNNLWSSKGSKIISLKILLKRSALHPLIESGCIKQHYDEQDSKDVHWFNRKECKAMFN